MVMEEVHVEIEEVREVVGAHVAANIQREGEKNREVSVVYFYGCNYLTVY